MKTDDLTDFLINFSNNITENNKATYKKIIDECEIKEFNNFEEFYLSVIYSFDMFLDAFIREKMCNNPDFVFIMKHSNFIKKHFSKIICMKEGSSCSSDKTRTIIKSLLSFYKDGTIIKFEYDSKYTYHLPKLIFKDHDSIIEFYKSVKSLFYGNFELYELQLKKYLN